MTGLNLIFCNLPKIGVAVLPFFLHSATKYSGNGNFLTPLNFIINFCTFPFYKFLFFQKNYAGGQMPGLPTTPPELIVKTRIWDYSVTTHDAPRGFST
jgi:hypothetical protein